MRVVSDDTAVPQPRYQGTLITPEADKAAREMLVLFLAFSLSVENC